MSDEQKEQVDAAVSALAHDLAKVVSLLRVRFGEFKDAFKVENTDKPASLEDVKADLVKTISILRGRFGEFDMEFSCVKGRNG